MVNLQCERDYPIESYTQVCEEPYVPSIQCDVEVATRFQRSHNKIIDERFQPACRKPRHLQVKESIVCNLAQRIEDQKLEIPRD